MWYAQTRGRRSAQIATDIAIVAWCILWVFLGRWVRALVASLADPARRMQDTGGQLRQQMTESGQQVADLPVVGERFTQVFGRLAGLGDEMSTAGAELVTSIDRLASVLGFAVAAAPILIAVVPWLVTRIRFMRRASAAARFIDDDADLDLFALRALARQPMTRLAAISDDPAGDWRRGDPRIIRRLAVLELRDSGITPPRLRHDAAARGRAAQEGDAALEGDTAQEIAPSPGAPRHAAEERSVVIGEITEELPRDGR